jgi:two-component system, NarL family, sensor kinase
VSEAEPMYKKGLEQREIMKDPFFYTNDMGALAHYYINNKQPKKAIEMALQGIEFSKKFRYKYNTDMLDYLTNAYEADGQYQKALETSVAYASMKDSLYNQTNQKAIADMQIKYDVQQKEYTIVQQKLSLNKRQNIIIGSLAALLATILAAY